MKRILSILSLTCLLALPALASTPPRLVVNIVVSQMRYDYLTRFGKNLSENGFKQFAKEGIVFSDSRYDFMQTITPATLATLTTGADPSTHGIVSERWIDYTSNRTIDLIADTKVIGLNCDAGIGQYSNENIIVPTLGDRLKEHSPESRVITIATDPVSAIVMGGESSDVYWMDSTRGMWVSSTAYMRELPQWVVRYDSLRVASQYLDYQWLPTTSKDLYVNNAYTIFDFQDKSRLRKLVSFDFLRKKDNNQNFQRLLYTPVGNSLVTEFVKQAVIYENLGKDEYTDLLNICFDTPRRVAQRYGGESMEVEDMFYRLDEELAELLTFLTAQVPKEEIVVVLTADHGASDSYDYGEKPRERFNTAQFKVILNGFMNTQYGPGDWVIDYCDRQIYLNRNLVYTNNLSLEEVQNRVAAFVLQFRGVAHVLTSTALQTSSFGGGYAKQMQNSFYPKRSGDLLINLMPGWIEEIEGQRTASGSMYEYDTHVPLMMWGARFYGQKISRPVDQKDVAPTLARIMQISRPIASEGEPIEEVTTLFE